MTRFFLINVKILKKIIKTSIKSKKNKEKVSLEINQMEDSLRENMLNNYLDKQQKMAAFHQFMFWLGAIGTGVSIPLDILVALGIIPQLKKHLVTVN
jgi:hypothetical protein